MNETNSPSNQMVLNKLPEITGLPAAVKKQLSLEQLPYMNIMQLYHDI